MSKLDFIVAGATLLAALALAPAARAQPAAGPPSGRYPCFWWGYNFQVFPAGITVGILDGGNYTTDGGKSTGRYQFVPNGAKIVYTSGKLKGVRSWYKRYSSGKTAIDMAFVKGGARRTIICGLMHR